MLLFISNKKKFRKLKSYIDHVALFQLLTATCNKRYQRMLQICAPDNFFYMNSSCQWLKEIPKRSCMHTIWQILRHKLNALEGVCNPFVVHFNQISSGNGVHLTV